MSKVLVTGGAGFIGSNLVDQLVQDGDEVIVVDDLSMGLASNIPSSPKVTFYEHSITDHGFMKDLLLKEQFDYIYLLAAIASVADSVARPYETHQINQEANIFILEIIRQHKLPIKKVLFTSSAAVYGNNPELPKREDSTIDPLTPYAIDKFATERFVIDYGKLYNIPTVAVRFFNVYGPRQNPKSPYSGVLSLITECLKNQRVFTLFGDGEQTRDFIFIQDVLLALHLIMSNSQAVHEVYNVATGKQSSLLNIITDYQKVTDQSLSVEYLPARDGDIIHSCADITKLKGLGFNSKYTLFLGLSDYWVSASRN
ncbi:NAD-dependent epimerase/dehydratase family protein (plasmid) [Lactiplantibacillus plantarum]|uniref:NAD-dependent epimerase/dehydratase family protein n=1 Tax=Lactiplantibacillus plantarum TaxID=1590 RepID=UPI000E29A7AD|nr:NAD-dependent epimerase/dehydratase family protein [Lactiplantibacillus plantarum]BBA83595.1 putative UDP-glucose 4-epimerase [Lactiplantibacillus plantarum]